MDMSVVETLLIRIASSENISKIFFIWQGGEPTLMGIDFYKNVIKLQKKYLKNKSVENAIQTNGILLNDLWCQFLKDNNILVGISIDGPEKFHNKYRKLKSGVGSFKDVMNAIELLNKHSVEFNTLTCINRQNSRYPVEIYNFLKDIGSKYMQFIPIVERKKFDLKIDEFKYKEDDVFEYSVQPLQYGKFMSEIFDQWVKKDVGSYFVRLFDVTLQAWIGLEPGLCIFQKSCSSSPVIEHNGDVFVCDHFVYPTFRIGNILKKNFNFEYLYKKLENFGNIKQNVPELCKKCDYYFICHGGCIKHRFKRTPDGEIGLNYLCEGYRYFFKHVTPYMNFMAQEIINGRPAYNIINFLNKTGTKPQKKVGRNDPCPCGSGKKYKNCCMRK